MNDLFVYRASREMNEIRWKLNKLEETNLNKAVRNVSNSINKTGIVLVGCRVVSSKFSVKFIENEDDQKIRNFMKRISFLLSSDRKNPIEQIGYVENIKEPFVIQWLWVQKFPNLIWFMCFVHHNNYKRE